jgi:hypothetical protein
MTVAAETWAWGSVGVVRAAATQRGMCGSLSPEVVVVKGCRNWARIRSCHTDAHVCRRLLEEESKDANASSLARATTSHTLAARSGPR